MNMLDLINSWWWLINTVFNIIFSFSSNMFEYSRIIHNCSSCVCVHQLFWFLSIVALGIFCRFTFGFHFHSASHRHWPSDVGHFRIRKSGSSIVVFVFSVRFWMMKHCQKSYRDDVYMIMGSFARMIHGPKYVEYFKDLTKYEILKDEFTRRMKTGDLFNVKNKFPLEWAIDSV